VEVSKAPPPLLGFNNNVRHRGRIFHIQTEDSGVKFPRIVTHLFADGGRIVKTTRTDYSEHVEKTDMAVVVRGMMKEQHKAMFAALRTGDLDSLLENVCGPLEPAKERPPVSVADPTAKHDLESARVRVGTSTGPTSIVAQPGEPSNLPMPVAVAAQPVADADALIESMKSLRDSEESPRKRAISNPNLRKPTPSVTPPVAEAFDLDVASLDKNPPKPTRSPPPPPVRAARKSNPAPRKSRPPIPARPAPAASAATGAAAAPEAGAGSVGRPATRAVPAQPGANRSIFGDGAISEQSLDEVILSYLAEDLEETK
jgi:hypothetical protein